MGLAKDAQWAEKPKPKTDRKPPEEGIEGEAEILLTYELIALALQTQQTSVVSYRQPVASVIKSMGMNYDPHALSHYGGSPTRTAANQLRDKKCTEMLAKSCHRAAPRGLCEGARVAPFVGPDRDPRGASPSSWTLCTSALQRARSAAGLATRLWISDS